MTKRMLIDATHSEETRVAVVSGNKLEEYDFESAARKQLKSNIYLVKVSRVEPSLQAAFVDFGGNRHGFLPFPEIHHDYYRIPIADREALLAEERAQAAREAAREEAEDEAALAAASEEGIDTEVDIDVDIEFDETAEESLDAEGDVNEEVYVPQHVGSIAEDIEQDFIVDKDEDGAEGEADETDEEELVEDEDKASLEADKEEEGEENDSEDEEEEAVEMVGGDVVAPPAYRSSIKRRYKIQEVIKRGQIMLIQINKEERGNKGAAVTTYISLPGRYCVLMPNSPRGGGVSRKVSNIKDRQRLKKILQALNVPDGMSVILRTAGVSRSVAEIKRDLDYLLRLWDQIRELTLKSSAPALIYEEGNLIKRAIRDLYKRDLDEVFVAGEEAYNTARDFMRTLMPSHVDRIHLYNDESMPLFARYCVESQIDEIHNPTVHLKSGGYIVINPTEAMVSVDVNSGRATKGRHIEETALKTNLEAAEEIARQLRLRDQGGLIVIDFIDMEDKRSNRIVERKLRDAMQGDRARIQLGRISPFGLLELSRQRLHPSLVESSFEVCKHCAGAGLVRTVETTGVIVLRAVEEEAMRGRGPEIKLGVPTAVALYILNKKRDMLTAIEKRQGVRVTLHTDDTLVKPPYTIEVSRGSGATPMRQTQHQAPVQGVDMSDFPELPDSDLADGIDEDAAFAQESKGGGEINEAPSRSRRRRRDRGGRSRHRSSDQDRMSQAAESAGDAEAGNNGDEGEGEKNDHRQRRRGRRGGRNRRRGGRGGENRNHNDVSMSNSAGPSVESGRTDPASATFSSAQPIEPSASSNDDDTGGSRKGWWKRLTE